MSKKTQPKELINVRVDARTVAVLKKIAARENRTFSAVVCMVLDDFARFELFDEMKTNKY